jgi:riboflavin kinase
MSSTQVQTTANVAAQSVRPSAPLRTEEFRTIRPQIVGPETPEPPFPILLSGPVQKGFGRGGKDLGCPTGLLVSSRSMTLIMTTQHQANLPDESITPLSTSVKTGVYYGYAQVIPPENEKIEWPSEDTKVLPMAMSLGWNPFYKNERLTAVGLHPLQPYIQLILVTGNSYHARIPVRLLRL